MPWFAIRSIYLFHQKEDGTNVFEERIVCFEADSPEAAQTKAKVESEKYATDHDFEVHPQRDGYEQDGEQLIDGYEVWSILYESRMSLADFYSTKYLQYDYHPPVL